MTRSSGWLICTCRIGIGPARCRPGGHLGRDLRGSGTAFVAPGVLTFSLFAPAAAHQEFEHLACVAAPALRGRGQRDECGHHDRNAVEEGCGAQYKCAVVNGL